MVEHTEPKIAHYGHDMARNDWYVHFRAVNPVTGKQKQFRVKKGINKFKTRSERIKKAVALRKAYSVLLDKEDYNPFTKRSDVINDISLPDLLQSMLDIKKSTLKPKSIRTYQDIINIFSGWLSSKGWLLMPPIKFSKLDAIAYLDYLLQVRHYGGKSHNQHLGSLKTMFNALAERGHIKANPFTGIKKLQESEGSHIPYSEDEKTKLLDYLKVKNKRLYYAVCFIYFCYIRRPELQQLKVRDIDLVNHSVIIHPYSAKVKRSRCITIPTAFEAVLREMKIDSCDPEHFIFGYKLQTCAKMINKPDAFSEAMARVNKKFGIKGKGFYTWKHTGVCALYIKTHDLYLCMAQAGHSDPKMTLRYLRSMGLSVNENIRKADFTF